MSRQSKIEESRPLLQQFADPLATIEPLNVEGYDDPDKLFEEINNLLRCKDNWETKTEAITTLMSYLKGNISQYTDLSIFAESIANCVSDLRSALVRQGSLLIAASAQIFQTRYLSSIKIVMPPLFSQLTHGTAVISNSCHYAIVSIARYVVNRQTISTILTYFNSKAKQRRLVVVESLHIALEEWDPIVLAPLSSKIINALELLKKDPDSVVRKIAHECPIPKEMLSPPSHAGQSPTANSSRIKTPTYPKNTTRTNDFKTPQSAHELLYPDDKTPPKKLFNSSRKSNKSSPYEGKKPKSPPTFIESPKSKSSILKTKVTSSYKSPSQAYNAIKPIPQIDDDDMNYLDLSTDIQDIMDSDSQPKPIMKRAKQIGKKTPRKVTIQAMPPPPIEEKEENLQIDSYMPPKTMDDAESFQEVLSRIIAEEKYEELEGLEDLMPPSILAAQQFLPQIDDWVDIFPDLIAKYQTEFNDHIPSLLVAFKFETWFIHYVTNLYGGTHIAEQFATMRNTQNDQVFKFFVVMINESIPFDLTETILKSLTKLSKTHKNTAGVELIIGVIKPTKKSDINMDVIIGSVLLKLKQKNPDLTNETQQLLNHQDETIELSEETQMNLDAGFLHVFENGARNQQLAALTFINNLSSKISFRSLIDQLLLIVETEDRNMRAKIHECIQIILKDISVVKEVISKLASLEEDSENTLEQTILNVLHQYFVDANADSLKQLLETVIKYVEPLLKSSITSIRRVAIFIYVEYRVKLPKEFSPYLKKLSIQQQKLIDLYYSKRK